MKKIACFLAAAAAMASFAVPASAATLIVDADGQLTGATGVNVDGSLFDVTFAQGSCIGLFNGCDQLSDFTFQTSDEGLAAADALLDQVFIDGPQGDFDSEPRTTAVCSGGQFPTCTIKIPISPEGLPGRSDIYDSADAINTFGVRFGVDRSLISGGTKSSEANFAIFSPSSITPAVPEPSTWAVMLIGFMLTGGAIRAAKRKPKVAVSYA